MFMKLVSSITIFWIKVNEKIIDDACHEKKIAVIGISIASILNILCNCSGK